MTKIGNAGICGVLDFRIADGHIEKVNNKEATHCLRYFNLGLLKLY